MQLNQVELVDNLNIIIAIQSEIINELFMQLSQHISAAELDNNPTVEKINLAARLRQDLE